jgi:hypothetical protein
MGFRRFLAKSTVGTNMNIDDLDFLEIDRGDCIAGSQYVDAYAETLALRDSAYAGANATAYGENTLTTTETYTNVRARPYSTKTSAKAKAEAYAGVSHGYHRAVYESRSLSVYTVISP